MTDQAVWRRACPSGQVLDLLHARVTEPYAPHVHEEYAVGACTAGREVIRYRGTLHYAGPGSLVVLEPGEAHTGAPADPPDFTYRVMYPAAGLLSDGMGGHRGSASRSSPIPGSRPSCAGCTLRWALEPNRWSAKRGWPGCWGSWYGGTPRRRATSRCAGRAGWPGW